MFSIHIRKRGVIWVSITDTKDIEQVIFHNFFVKYYRSNLVHTQHSSGSHFTAHAAPLAYLLSRQPVFLCLHLDQWEGPVKLLIKLLGNFTGPSHRSEEHTLNSS